MVGLAAALPLVAACDRVFGFDHVPLVDTDAPGTSSIAKGWGPPQQVMPDTPAGAWPSDPSFDLDETYLFYSVIYTNNDYDIFEAKMLDHTKTGPRANVLVSPSYAASPELAPSGTTMYWHDYTMYPMGRIQIATAPTVAGPWTAGGAPADLNIVVDDNRPGSPDAAGDYMVIARNSALLGLHHDTGTWIPDASCDTINGQLAIHENPQVSADGLTLVFAGAPTPGQRDLYVSQRTSIDESWPLADVLDASSGSFDEGDPWLSKDTKRLYFTHNKAIWLCERP